MECLMIADIHAIRSICQSGLKTGPAAVRHAVLDLVGFRATYRMTGPGPKQTVNCRSEAEAAHAGRAANQSFAAAAKP